MLAMGANYGDLDNDGRPRRLHRHRRAEPVATRWCPTECIATPATGLFQDVTTSGGFGHLQKGHGIAFGDIDNDGDQDVYHGDGRCV